MTPIQLRERLIHSADITLFQKHLKLELDEIRQAVGCAATVAAEKSSINI